MSDDDDNLWDFATSDVKPLSKPSPLTQPEKPKKKDVSKAEKIDKPFKNKQKTQETLQKRTPVAEQGRELDRRTAERFRKGQIPIEARLDLHGKNQVEAQGALQDFILSSASRGFRCVLVITGKGAAADGRRDPLIRGEGVLRQKLPEWLHEGALAPIVLSFTKARPQHGGEGAFYVLLRRKRL